MECPAHGALSPETLGGSPGFIVLCVKDVDAQVHAALEAGAKILRPLQDQFSGDRSATLADPFGYRWTLTTQVEDIPRKRSIGVSRQWWEIPVRRKNNP